ncbi:MAG: hypothetical protein IPN76_09270 [Saprospiraceae bacterium]|nr:hypothetical protein [Saprospiraceae bacterium]
MMQSLGGDALFIVAAGKPQRHVCHLRRQTATSRGKSCAENMTPQRLSRFLGIAYGKDKSGFEITMIVCK